jgi:hypothetical protein
MCFLAKTVSDIHNRSFSSYVYVYPYVWPLQCLYSVAAKERLFPVADATTFFTDMHFILRVLAAGDIRTVCHHRLNLLEQVILLILCWTTCRFCLSLVKAMYQRPRLFMDEIMWFHIDRLFLMYYLTFSIGRCHVVCRDPYTSIIHGVNVYQISFSS